VVHPPLDGGGTQTRLLRALVANVQREDVNPIEEGQVYRRMRDEFGWNVNEIHRRTGVERVRIDNLLLLTKLEPEIQELIASGRYPKDANLVRAVLRIPDREAAVAMVQGQSGRGTTLKGCILAAKRLAEILESGTPVQEAVRVPSMTYARERAGLPAGEEEPRRWNAMVELGVVPPWGMLSRGAFDTCAECELRNMASHAVCGRCQLVDMLRRLMEAAK
jgi:hypothetical protein